MILHVLKLLGYVIACGAAAGVLLIVLAMIVAAVFLDLNDDDFPRRSSAIRRGRCTVPGCTRPALHWKAS